jgi:hypothetical protein
MADFDNMVRLRLKKLGHDAENDSSESTAIQSLITNWTDAVRHFDSAIAADASGKQAQANKATTMTYLKRLQELIEEEKQQTEQSMPAPRSDPNAPKEDGQSDEKQSGENGDEDKERSGSGDNGDDKKENSGGDEENEDNPDKKSGQKPDDKKDKKDASKEGSKPDETPEERARRILKENADLEKGPLSPGQRLFRDPEKDW